MNLARKKSWVCVLSQKTAGEKRLEIRNHVSNMEYRGLSANYQKSLKIVVTFRKKATSVDQ